MSHRIIHQLADHHLPQLHSLYQQAWWTNTRTIDDTCRVVAGSTCLVGIVDDDDELIGFARILTDGVFKATIYDVIVDESLHGSGLGRVLMQAVVDHPQLAGVRDLDLYCAEDMIPFYERWGFTDQLGDLKHMRQGATGSDQ
jgi:predicted GNAT family N-acyltransferase